LTTARLIEMALLSATSYRHDTASRHYSPAPPGWTELSLPGSLTRNPSSDFSAVVYQRGNEIAIAYTGTDAKPTEMALVNLPLFAGAMSQQLKDAALLYAEVRRRNPGADITLTGHSLGGGLAALVGVFFNERAYTFDVAPFRKAASDTSRDALLQHLRDQGFASGNGFDQAVTARLQSFAGLSATSERLLGSVIRGEQNITAIALRGDLLSGSALDANRIRAGYGRTPYALLDHGMEGLGGGALHSIDLLAALLHSPALLGATWNLPAIGSMLLDRNLFASPRQTDSAEDLLTRLLQHEFGTRNLPADVARFDPDAMLTRFTHDVRRLAGPAVTGTHGGIDPVVHAVMEYYYRESAPNAGNAPFVEGGWDGLRIDTSRIAHTGPAPASRKTMLDALLLAGWFDEFKVAIPADVADKPVWYLSRSNAPLTTGSVGDTADLMVGSTSADRLIGNAGSDLLLAGNGSDVLEGGEGADTLVGGAGVDTYLYRFGDGRDLMVDRDGRGRLVIVSGQGVVQSTAFFRDPTTPNQWVNAEGTLVLSGGARWKIIAPRDGEIDLGADFTSGQFGVTFSGERLGSNPARTIQGDRAPKDHDLDTPGIQARYDDLGNVIVTTRVQASREDVLNDSAGDDLIRAGGGDDIVNAFRGGHDSIDAGSGNDRVGGYAGNDTIAGGSGTDLLSGGTGDDALFAGTLTAIGTALAEGGAQASIDERGDWLGGNAGDDIAIGDARNDLVTAGASADIVQGGGGHDTLYGDHDVARITTAWHVTRSITEDGGVRHYRVALQDIEFTGGASDDGNDALYGGTGDDWLFAGGADDIAEGGAGDDVVFGHGGNDILSGGAGNDILVADDLESVLEGAAHGADFLDGGAGDDVMSGNGGDDVLMGGEGNDTLAGDGDGNGAWSGTDHLDGGGGDDTLQGGGASDVLLGGGGADHLEGDDAGIDPRYHGADFLDGGEGDDTLFGGGGSDLLSGGAGHDTLDGDHPDLAPDAHGADHLEGGSGIDRLNGRGGDDTLDGGDDADHLTGGDGNDTLTGGSGADLLEGGAGDDRYIVAGNDTILDDTGDNTVVINATLDASITIGLASIRVDDTVVRGLALRVDADTTVSIGGGFANTIRAFQFRGEAAPVGLKELFTRATPAAQINLSGTSGADTLFGAGAHDTLRGLEGNDTLDGGNGNDVLEGGAGDDTLDGAGGLDTLKGGDGSDHYHFGRGSGQEWILDTGPSGTDTIHIDAQAAEVAVRREGDALVLAIDGARDALGQAESLTVHQYFERDGSGPAVVERVEFADGTAWDVGTVKAQALIPTDRDDVIAAYATDDTLQGSGGNDWLDGRGGHDTLSGGAGRDRLLGDAGDDTLRGDADDDILLGGIGNDTLEGGTGNNTLDGGAGNDTYLAGFAGHDRIENHDGDSVTTDRIVIGGGVRPRDIVFGRTGADDQHLVLRLRVGGGAIELAGFDDPLALGTFGAIDEIRFDADPATTWSYAQLRGLALATGLGHDTAWGFRTDDTLDGQAGDDTLHGLGGHDHLSGSEGRDVLSGGTGDDTLDGGAGDDTLIGGAANDAIVFGRGDGHDTLVPSLATPSGWVTDAGEDTVRLRAGLGVGDVTLHRHADDLVLVLGDDPAQLWARDWFRLPDKPFEHIAFADGTVWNATNIAGRIIAGMADTLTGGPGDDAFAVDHVNDIVIESVGGGIDTVASTVTFSLPDSVEHLILAGRLDIDATGNAAANVITGNAGRNMIDGRGGIDTLTGGAGNDTYLVATPGGLEADTDVVIERPGEGIDTVVANMSYTLPAHVEHLVATGGGTLAPRFSGNGQDNLIDASGRFGSATLDGGAGADTLVGHAWAETIYVVDDAGDVVIEQGPAGGPDDTVYSAVTFTLPDEVEHLRLTGSGAIDGIGNALANRLHGNDAANHLAGHTGGDELFGGKGADTLAGGPGDDTYVLADERFVTHAGIAWLRHADTEGAVDLIVETADGGTDTVYSVFDHALAPGVEHLTLLDIAAPEWDRVGDLRGTGNALDNRLTGNARHNTLDGGAGSDTLRGRDGHDTYVVDRATDSIVEEPDEGVDTVMSAVSWTLGANVEVLRLTGPVALSGTGNAHDNLLVGNGRSNTLAGGAGHDILQGLVGNDVLTDTSGRNAFIGGAGNDTLTGGTGSEFFVGGTQNDRIVTSSGIDVIAFNRGDGQDTIVASRGPANNTLSLGRGIAYDDVTLSRSGNALVVGLGGTDRMNLADWYTHAQHRSVGTLQFIAESMRGFNPAGGDPLLSSKVTAFDFIALVDAFDAARAADPTPGPWQAHGALDDAFEFASDTAAIGGSLAHAYGRTGSLSGASFHATTSILTDAGFGNPQALAAPEQWQAGPARLT